MMYIKIYYSLKMTIYIIMMDVIMLKLEKKNKMMKKHYKN